MNNKHKSIKYLDNRYLAVSAMEALSVLKKASWQFNAQRLWLG
jgi:hypothetical protein